MPAPHSYILSGGHRGHRKFGGFLYHSKYQIKTVSSAETRARGTSPSARGITIHQSSPAKKHRQLRNATLRAACAHTYTCTHMHMYPHLHPTQCIHTDMCTLLCMHTCMCTIYRCMHACTPTHTYTYTHTHTHARSTNVCMRTHPHSHICMCKYTCIDTHAYVCTHPCTHILNTQMHARACAGTCAHIHMYTHSCPLMQTLWHSERPMEPLRQGEDSDN